MKHLTTKTKVARAAMTLLVAMLGSVTGALADETLTVYENETEENSNVPIWGLWADTDQQSEFIIPASELAELKGGTITQMTFHLSSPAMKKWDGTARVYLREVAVTTFSSPYSYFGVDGATIVYTGGLDATSDEMEVEFTTPYAYSGGNLLVGFTYITDDNYSSASFYGKSVTNASISHKGSDDISAWGFIPRTTFTYEPAFTGCDMPIAIAVSDITTDGATVTWEGDGDKWNLRYKASTDNDYTLIEGLTAKTYTFEGTLTGATTYRVGVQTDCGSGSTSTFKSISFTSANACAAPTNLQITDITTSSATLTWTPGYQETSWTAKYKKHSEDWNVAVGEIVTGAPSITLSNLEGTTTYDVQVYNCEDYASATFTTAADIPLEEEFGTAIPNGWNRYTGLLSNVMNGASLSTSDYSWYLGSRNGVFDNHAYVNIYGTNCCKWLVLPTVVMKDNVQLTFDMALTMYNGTLAEIDKTTGQDDRFIVLITTDGGTTWEILREWNNTGSTYVYNNIVCSATGQSVAIDLSSYAGKSIAVAFYGESTVENNDNDLHIDNVSIGYIPTCAKPTRLACSDVTATTVKLSWTNGEEGQNAWQVCLNDDETNLIAANANPFTVEGLTPETAYTAKVRAYCSADDQSKWSKGVSFTTPEACPKPSGLTVDGITFNTATLSWTERGEATSWQVCLEGGEEAPTTVTEKSYTFTGLSAFTEYTAKVRAVGNGIYSAWVETTFTTLESCLRPSGLMITSITDNTATLTWTENGEATSWQVCLEGGEEAPTTVTGKSYTFTGLNVTSEYTAKVRAVGNGEYSAWVETTFMTTAVAVAVGNSWSDDFEGETCGWEFVNGGYTNRWIWDINSNDGVSSHAIYISNYNNFNQCDYNSASMVFATKLLNFTEGKHIFSYDWRGWGEDDKDYLRVALVPGAQVITATTPAGFSSSSLPSGWIALDGGSKLNGSLNLQNKEILATVPASGNYYLVIAWKNDESGGTAFPAGCVDNVSITRMACQSDAENFALSTYTTTTADLRWDAVEGTEWQLAYSPNSDFTNATEISVGESATCELTGLRPCTAYYAKVHAHCGGDDYGTWSEVLKFATCGVITDKQWKENFDSYDGSTKLPTCWNRINTSTSSSYSGYPEIYDNQSYAHSGNKSLLFYSYYGNDPQDQYAVLPEIEQVSGKQVKFFARKCYNSYDATFTVGIMTDPQDVSTFTEIGTCAPATETCEPFTILLNTYTGEGNYIAIKMQAANTADTNRSVLIDDITVEDIPTCLEPTNLTVTVINATTATFSWTNGEEGQDTWQICLNGDETNLIQADGNPYTVEGLTAETINTAKVRAYCSETDQSYWSNEVTFVPTDKLVIGLGTDTNYDLPTNNYYKYSLTQQIYTTPELGEPGFIESIDFYKKSTIPCERVIDIYMVSTDKSSFESKSDWIPVTDADLVFSGKVTFADNAWTCIKLDNVFVYDGTKNVAIIVDDNTGSYVPYSTGFLAYTTSENQALYYKDDSNNYDPKGTPGEASDRTTSKNQIRILKKSQAGCVRPTSLEATEVGPDFATLSWNENGEASEWKVEVTNVQSSEIITMTANEIPFTVSGLSNETEYSVKVSPTCEENLWSREITFTTLEANPVPTDLDATTTFTTATLSWTGYGESYNVKCSNVNGQSDLAILSQDFESGLNGWTRSNCGQHSNVDIYSKRTGDQGFRFTYMYTPPQYLISPALSDVTDNTKLDFYYKNNDSGKVETFQVGYSSTTSDTDQFAFSETITASNTQWQHYSAAIPAGTKYICFKHLSENQGNLFIDDITVTASSTTFSTLEATATITDLTPGAEYQYQVQSVYGGVTSEWSEIATFSTKDDNPVPTDMDVSTTHATATISWTGISDSYQVRYRPVGQSTVVHLSEGFESGNSWTRRDCDDNSNRYDGQHHSGSMCFRFCYHRNRDDKNPQYLISPELSETANKLEFYYRSLDNRYTEKFQVGFSSTTNATDAFTFGNEYSTSDETWRLFSQDILAGTKYICLKYTSNEYNLLIDDIVVTKEWDTASSTESMVTLTGLDPETTYEYQIQSILGTKASQWSPVATFTTMPPVEITLVNDATDNTSQLANYTNGVYANVTLSGRELYKDNYWNTLCLPFSIADINAEGSTLAGAIVRELDDASISGTTLTLNFKNPTTTIKAGAPYIVKWEVASNSTIADPVFSGVTIDKTDNSYDNKVEGDTRVRFLGTYDAMTFNGEGFTEDRSILFLSGNNTLYYPQVGVDEQSGNTVYPFIGACRAYFKIGNDGAGARLLTAFNLNFGDNEGEAQGIGDAARLNNNEERINNKWYTVDGRKLDTKPTKKGLYIVGGKKVVIP